MNLGAAWESQGKSLGFMQGRIRKPYKINEGCQSQELGCTLIYNEEIPNIVVLYHWRERIYEHKV